MNELTTDIKALHEETLNNLRTSKANNTLRAYRSDFNDFSGFCVKHGFKSMPTEKLLTSKAKTLLFLSNIFPLFAKREYSECDRLITCLSKKLS